MRVNKGVAETRCSRGNCFTIGRIPVKVTSDPVQLLGPVKDVLRPCPQGLGENFFHLHVRYGSEPSSWRNGSLRLFWGGMLRGGIPSEYYAAAGQRIMYLPGRAWGRLDFEQRVMEIACEPGQEVCAHEGCLLPLLCEFLAYHGHFVIHAASLAFERQGEMVGILLAGVSGAGKTTTALALAHAGMALLSDDMSLIESPGPNGRAMSHILENRPIQAAQTGGSVKAEGLGDGGWADHRQAALDDATRDSTTWDAANGFRVRLWGLQLPCKVHDNTRRLLPWLDACPPTPARTQGEVRLDVRVAIGESTGIVADPRLVLLLGPRSAGRHVLERLDKTQAMTQLTSENIRVYEHRADGTPGSAFRALGQLVAQCDVYRLSVGEPLSGLAEQVYSLPGWSA